MPKVDFDDNSITPSPGYTELPASYHEYNRREHCSTCRNLFSSLPHPSLGKLRVVFAEELRNDVQEHYSTDTLPENIGENICFEYAAARNEPLRAEMYSRVQIDKIKAKSDQCAHSTRLLCDEVYDTSAVLRSQLQWMKKSSTKELMQHVLAYQSLVTQLQREEILRRNVISSHAQERRCLVCHEHLPYHTKVLACTTKVHLRG